MSDQLPYPMTGLRSQAQRDQQGDYLPGQVVRQQINWAIPISLMLVVSGIAGVVIFSSLLFGAFVGMLVMFSFFVVVGVIIGYRS